VTRLLPSILILCAAVASTAPARGQTVVPVFLPDPDDTLRIDAAGAGGDTLWQVHLGSGWLVLADSFRKETAWPPGHWSEFPHVELDADTASQGHLAFLNCALGPRDTTAAWWRLPPVPPDSTELVLANCWLHGAAGGAVLPAAGGGRLLGLGTWFTVEDTALVVAGGAAEFEDCVFAWSEAGVVQTAGETVFRGCTFASLTDALELRGGSALLSRALLQSDKIMLRVADSAAVTLDSCHFYEVGRWCVEGIGDLAGTELGFADGWFDASTAPPARRASGYPASALADTLDAACIEALEPAELVIVVDESDPLTAGEELPLLAAVPLRAVDGRPFRPRRLTLHCSGLLPEPPTGGAVLEAADTTVVVDLATPAMLAAPAADSLLVPVAVVEVEAEGGLLISATVSGGFGD